MSKSPSFYLRVDEVLPNSVVLASVHPADLASVLEHVEAVVAFPGTHAGDDMVPLSAQRVLFGTLSIREDESVLRPEGRNGTS